MASAAPSSAGPGGAAKRWPNGCLLEPLSGRSADLSLVRSGVRAIWAVYGAVRSRFFGRPPMILTSWGRCLIVQLLHPPCVEGNLSPSARAAIAFSGSAILVFLFHRSPSRRSIEAESGHQEIDVALPATLLLKNDDVVSVFDPKIGADSASAFLVLKSDNLVPLGMVENGSRPCQTPRPRRVEEAVAGGGVVSGNDVPEALLAGVTVKTAAIPPHGKTPEMRSPKPEITLEHAIEAFEDLGHAPTERHKFRQPSRAYVAHCAACGLHRNRLTLSSRSSVVFVRQ